MMRKIWSHVIFVVAALCLSPGLVHAQGDVVSPIADPGTMADFSQRIGDSVAVTITGSTDGSVWGDAVYTSDSNLAAAAVHSGLLRPDETAVLVVDIVDGLNRYTGSTRNGVTTLSYGTWSVAYRFQAAQIAAISRTYLPDPGNLTNFRDRVGSVLRLMVTGSLGGSVWGDVIYTDDSLLAAAAVHAGLLEDGRRGVVEVEILPGQGSYDAATHHGVASGSYAAWHGSFRFVMPDGPLKTKRAE